MPVVVSPAPDGAVVAALLVHEHNISIVHRVQLQVWAPPTTAKTTNVMQSEPVGLAVSTVFVVSRQPFSSGARTSLIVFLASLDLEPHESMSCHGRRLTLAWKGIPQTSHYKHLKLLPETP